MSEEFRITYEDDEVLKLFRDDVLIGIISTVSSNYPHITGKVKLEPAGESYLSIWNFLQQPDATNTDPPFDYAALQHGWFLEDTHGQRQAIYLPGVKSGTIMFRFKRVN